MSTFTMEPVLKDELARQVTLMMAEDSATVWQIIDYVGAVSLRAAALGLAELVGGVPNTGSDLPVEATG